MRIAICDDEKNIRELIGNKVAKQYPEADIIFFQSGEELLLSDKHIDILFLDIQMSGKNGMETARELRKKDKSVILIFVTAVEDIVYAEVFNRKVVIHKLDDEIEYYGKMSDLEAVAGDSFFRPHRAYLVNFKYVEKYDATTIYLEKGTALMAKQNYPDFVKKYMKYNQRKG